MVPLVHAIQHPKRHLGRFSRFCTAQGGRSLYFTMGRPFSRKIAPSHGEYGPPCNACFLEPTRAVNPNGISICSAVFAGVTTMTDRQTTTRSVTIGRIYVRSTAMRPKIVSLSIRRSYTKRDVLRDTKYSVFTNLISLKETLIRLVVR